MGGEKPGFCEILRLVARNLRRNPVSEDTTILQGASLLEKSLFFRDLSQATHPTTSLSSAISLYQRPNVLTYDRKSPNFNYREIDNRVRSSTSNSQLQMV